ncbi:glutathione S-transferase family protein [Rubellimicrobium roseum]|uniref:Glutathione S-transferase family protein n=1 Tax=Rubellimicrobium roseum TaxID=687525 RepID=A0A5C4N9V6_9RHOB|nr:glutathione S-transferase family protein [Rubellimicrobium roseum]TNC71624.1 glutathione S-transferase family protein [Rubellimicrobium roseum]
MPVLYGSYRSRATRNLWLAGEIGLELELRQVWQAYRLDKPDAPDAPFNTRSRGFLSLSPMGAIPVLVDGDLVLAESLAINLYLARRYGGDLGPRDEAENALMTQWTLFAATAMEGPGLAIQNVHTYGRADSEAGRGEIADKVEALGRPLRVLEGHLGRDGHMVGGRFTVADINVAEILRYAQSHEPLLAEYPAVDGWLRACQARPAFRAMWDRRAAEPMWL